MKIPTGKCVIISDAIYYNKVLATAKKWVDNKNKVLLIFDIYTSKPNRDDGEYDYYDGEGTFRVYEDWGKLMLENYPRENPSCYRHELF